MSDVFVSYKAEDRKRVAPLVEALEADGLTVWWDAQIGGGDEWRRSIEQQLDAAKCVLVVWSKRSTAPEGRFVRDEASRAMERGVYLPVRIDNVRLPLGFGETQALALTGWKSGANDPRYRAVLSAVRAIVGGIARHEHRAVAHERAVDRRLVLGGGAAAVVAAGIGGWFLFKPGSAEAAGSIAVLPFANLSSDPNQAYFSDGLAEELRSALARAGLQVVGRTSSEAVRGADAETAARKLGVANILTGSVRRSPSTIRVSAQLIKGSDGLERWSQDYDRKPGDVLTIQSNIAENVAKALSVALGKAAKAALTLGGTTNAAAQDLYFKANAQLSFDDSEPSLRHGIGLLDAAITLDPKFAEAYIVKSYAMSFLVDYVDGRTMDFDAYFKQAEAVARQAVALAPGLAAAHAALGSILGSRLNLNAALAEFQAAQALPGEDAPTLVIYSGFLAQIGDARGALAAARKAQAKDPLNWVAYTSEGYALGTAGRLKEAVAACRKAVTIAPKAENARSLLGLALIQAGQNSEAAAVFSKAPPDFMGRLTGEAIIAAREGDRAASDRALQRLQQLFGDSASWQYVDIHAQRGEKELALAAVERAWVVRDPELASMKYDPFAAPVRTEPRFIAIEKKLNFPKI
jgi:TolB-like protein/Tfp pilus assembly protein PilF